MNPHSTVYSLRRRACAALLVPALGLGTAVVAAPVAGADEAVTTAGAAAATEIATVPGDADFFALPDATDTAAADLASLAPGTPLKQRSVPARINNLGDMPVTMTPIQYRTTTVTGEPTVAVTSVLQPPVGVQRTGDTVMYASFYDSMNPEDGPSRVLVRGAQSGML
ncbi:MAG: triacylglycerol lipase, partial [Corynebacterium variabile]|nr:triacylglycerol lipase [Corynebacterium variabile]